MSRVNGGMLLSHAQIIGFENQDSQKVVSDLNDPLFFKSFIANCNYGHEQCTDGLCVCTHDSLFTWNLKSSRDVHGLMCYECRFCRNMYRDRSFYKDDATRKTMEERGVLTPPHTCFECFQKEKLFDLEKEKLEQMKIQNENFKLLSGGFNIDEIKINIESQINDIREENDKQIIKFRKEQKKLFDEKLEKEQMQIQEILNENIERIKTTLQTKMNLNFDCAVCLEIIKKSNMIILSCKHSFCKTCVNLIAIGKLIKCPLCRAECDLK